MFLEPLLHIPGALWGLTDLDTGSLLAEQVEAALDSASRRRGLLGRDRLDNTAMVIAPCSAIHMFFMRFALDVIFVNRQGGVLKVCQHVRPWRIAFAWRAFAAIEVAAGEAERAGIRPGHTLFLTPRALATSARTESRHPNRTKLA